MKLNSDITRIILVIFSLLALTYLINKYQSNKDSKSSETFANTVDYNSMNNKMSNNVMQNNNMHNNEHSSSNNSNSDNNNGGVFPSEIMGQNEIYKPVGEELMNNNVPNDCYPKDRLTSDDLLPKDANSKWAQVNPSGQGDVRDQNFLNAGFLVGINTVGQSMKNPNLQLRSEPPNPQLKVSPWNQSTIDPDLNRKPLEVGGCQ